MIDTPDAPPVRIWRPEDEPATAVIEHHDGLYWVTLHHGLMEIGPAAGGVILGWIRLTKRSAQRKAVRELTRYERELAACEA